jgi:hypothetical protein
MKRFAAVLALGLGLFVAAHAEAGKLPQGVSMVQRIGIFRPPHPATSKTGQAAPRAVEKLGQFRSPHPEGIAAR